VLAVAACSAEPTPQGALGARADTLRPAVVTDGLPNDSDDPAIWVDTTAPARSLVLGTDKGDSTGGVFVFDVSGRIDASRSRTPLRRMNNVDIIGGLRLGGRLVDIAVATERGTLRLRVFRLPEMTPIDGGGLLVFDGDTARAPMGVALYRRPRDGAVFAVVGGKGGPRAGYLWQYLLEDDGAGRVRATKVRAFGAFSGAKEIEAIAVDRELGFVYYGDETVGVRKYHADPSHPEAARELALFATTEFVRDHEGIAIYPTGDSTGYLLASDQQGQRLQVFRREGDPGSPHAHGVIATIPVAARETDGIEVTAQPLGERFPEGLLVMMSTDRTFHFYDWRDIARRLPPRR
jgi:3-phytase